MKGFRREHHPPPPRRSAPRRFRDRLHVRDRGLGAIFSRSFDVSSEWQPIETAPIGDWSWPLLTCRMGEPMQCFGNRPVAGYAEPPEAAYWNEHGDCWTPIQRPHDMWKPTHWMPIPTPPAASELTPAHGSTLHGIEAAVGETGGEG